MYKIYRVEDYYKTKHNDENAFVSDDIECINNELIVNKGYHLLLQDNVKYKLFMDLDDVKSEEQFQQFIQYMEAEFRLEVADLSYTRSTNTKGLLSYHLVYVFRNGFLHNQKKAINIIKSKEYYVENFEGILDDSFYKDNYWFRLPGQTNKDKPNAHQIIKGNIEDFVLNYFIPSDDADEVEEEEEEFEENKLRMDKIKGFSFNTNYNYSIPDDIVQECLDNLDDKYVEEYEYWSQVTNCLKLLNKQTLWNNWSKQGSSYNFYKNMSHWRGQKKQTFSLEWLSKVSNTNISKVKKEYKPLTKPVFNTKQMNSSRVFVSNDYKDNQLTYDDFKRNKIIVIESTTGTGKTTATAIHTAKYLKEHPECKVLSLIDRVVLANQHIKSFKDQGIKMKSYQEDSFEFDNYTICINSLLKLSDLYDSNELKDYVVYIDEIEGFLQFTHNDKLNKNMKQIYLLLLHILKNCKKVIVSDAVISDNTINLLASIKTDKFIFIKNSFKKYENVPAIKINDENRFLEILRDHIANDKYFMFLSDSKTIITKFYTDLLLEDKKSNFFIYTDDQKTEIITDASKQLLNKFVFASPSIERGLDFSIDSKQDVFIYITGRSINSQGLFQQTTRTRNIDNLYYYCNALINKSVYDSLETVVDLYLNNIEQNSILNNICLNINEDDEMKMCNNTFFKLFTYTEYKADILNTNIIAHYEQQLFNNGFLLSSECEKKKLSKEDTKKMKDKVDEINEQLFNDYINDVNIRNLPIYEKLNERIRLLNLPKNKTDILIKYKEQLTDQYKLADHYNTMRIFKSDQYIEQKFLEAIDSNFDCKTIDNVYNKIKIIKTMESRYNITTPKDFKCSYNNKMTDEEYNLIKTLFRISKEKPTDNTSILQMYVTMIKNVCGKGIITSTQERVNGIKQRVYKYNQEYLDFQKELAVYYSPIKVNKLLLESEITIDIDELNEFIKDGKQFVNNYYIDKIRT